MPRLFLTPISLIFTLKSHGFVAPVPLMVNTEKEKKMSQISQMFIQIVERLAEMFPDSDYQSRLEHYIVSHNPQNAAEVEHWERKYLQNQHRGFV